MVALEVRLPEVKTITSKSKKVDFKKNPIGTFVLDGENLGEELICTCIAHRYKAVSFTNDFKFVAEFIDAKNEVPQTTEEYKAFMDASKGYKISEGYEALIMTEKGDLATFFFKSAMKSDGASAIMKSKKGTQLVGIKVESREGKNGFDYNVAIVRKVGPFTMPVTEDSTEFLEMFSSTQALRIGSSGSADGESDLPAKD